MSTQESNEVKLEGTQQIIAAIVMFLDRDREKQCMIDKLRDRIDELHDRIHLSELHRKTVRYNELYGKYKRLRRALKEKDDMDNPCSPL